MKMAIENNVDKRGTISVHYGFTMSKCTDIITKNALYDYNIPTHCSSIPNKNEVQWVLLNINTLLLNFEKLLVKMEYHLELLKMIGLKMLTIH